MAGLNDLTLANYMDIKIGDVLINNIESFGGLSEEMGIVEVKHFNSKFARKIPTSGTVAAVELTLSFIPSDAGYQALMAAKDAMALSDFTVIYYKDVNKVDQETRSFKGYVASYTEAGEFDTQRTVTFSITVDGAITYGTATRAAK